MRIIILANINSVLWNNLAVELVKKTSDEIYVMDFFKGLLMPFDEKTAYCNFVYPANPLKKKIFIFSNCFKSLFKLLFLPKRDILMIHYVIPFYGCLSFLLKWKANVIISSVYGSDFYLVPKWKGFLQSWIFNVSQSITFSNTRMRDGFSEKFPHYKDKTVICRFGLSLLRSINTQGINRSKACQKLEVPEDKIIVVCGHSSSKREQHVNICKVVNGLNKEIQKKIFLLLPLTYNLSEDLSREISSFLEKTDLSYKMLSTRLSTEETACLRICSDVMLNLPLSDQMTAAMLETLYCGGTVITGSWLPYKTLDEYGISYIKVDDIKSILSPLEKIIHAKSINTEVVDTSPNREIIKKHFSWESCINDWLIVLQAYQSQ